MWGVGRLEVHGIGSRRQMYKEVFEAIRNQTIRNLTFSDLEIPLVLSRPKVIALKKTRFLYLLDLLGETGEGSVSFSVCGASLEDRADGVSLMSFSRMVWF